MPDRSRALSIVVAIFVLLVLVLGHVTEAGWTSATTIAGVSMRSGTLDVRVDGQDTVSGSSALDLSGMVPGSSASADVVVSNAGSVPLRYVVGVSGTDPDGKALAAALATDVSLGDCAGPALGAGHVLSPGDSEHVCVKVGLPSAAPASVAAAATELTLVVRAAKGGWSDSAPVAGSRMSTVALTSPDLMCGPLGLGTLTLRWSSVPGATDYRIHYGAGGSMVETVPADVLMRTFSGVAGVATVQAIFGSSTWASAPSQSLSYSAVGGLTGTCG
ncbi:hypothetical protein ABLE68_10900 [Nocardioides sp. CN2-186]|uniref:hypothetical protein n=1 Tax=Nocardioides tweenelious TaxID=3156607 RepID=UPI0032B4650F